MTTGEIIATILSTSFVLTVSFLLVLHLIIKEKDRRMKKYNTISIVGTVFTILLIAYSRNLKASQV